MAGGGLNLDGTLLRGPQCPSPPNMLNTTKYIVEWNGCSTHHLTMQPLSWGLQTPGSWITWAHCISLPCQQRISVSKKHWFERRQQTGH